jgi:hypothetical protein
MSAEERGRPAFLDLLIATLLDHEKTMSSLIDRLEKTVKDLSNAKKEKSETAASNLDTLVYMKIKTGRPIDETVKIIESLKE